MNTIINIKDWNIWKKDIGNKPLIVSGPCSAETETQLLETARALSVTNRVDLLRAGIWKPRTRPNSFEGVGEIGLEWLAKAKEQTGLPTCTEVANAAHTEKALKSGVDVLWLGARTTVNPFAVQEIADVLKGVDIPVMVKNPINPDLELWIGAIERIMGAGIQKIAAIHRGFSVYGKHDYRNLPQWEIPIELKRRIAGLELINDPSHIGGKRKYIHSLAQKAYDLGFNGLMIEAHPNPDEAWSDAKQQVTPQRLMQILDDLIYPQTSSNNPQFIDQLQLLRTKIDSLDKELVEILAKRIEIVQEIGAYKKENNVAILQMERWAEIYQTRRAWAADLGVRHNFITALLEAIHIESIEQQTTIIHPENNHFHTSVLEDS